MRNHDELTLDKLSDDERAEVFAAFGPEETMQVYGRGLRRRLPPMLDGDPRRVRMVYSLLFSLPGTPVLFYGEEIGMGEDLDAEGRLAVRTPDAVDGGPQRRLLHRRAPQAARAGGRAAASRRSSSTCQDQRHDPDSLLIFMKLLIRRYRESPELGWGTFTVLDQPHAAVLAHLCSWDDGALVAVHNLAAEPRTVPLTLEGCDASHRLVDLCRRARTSLTDKGTAEIALDGYGYRWLRVVAAGQPAAWSSSPAAAGRRRAREPARAPGRERRACPRRPGAGAGRAGRRSRPGPATSAAAVDPTEATRRWRPGA